MPSIRRRRVHWLGHVQAVLYKMSHWDEQSLPGLRLGKGFIHHID